MVVFEGPPGLNGERCRDSSLNNIKGLLVDWKDWIHPGVDYGQWIPTWPGSPYCNRIAWNWVSAGDNLPSRVYPRYYINYEVGVYVGAYDGMDVGSRNPNSVDSFGKPLNPEIDSFVYDYGYQMLQTWSYCPSMDEEWLDEPNGNKNKKKGMGASQYYCVDDFMGGLGGVAAGNMAFDKWTKHLDRAKERSFYMGYRNKETYRHFLKGGHKDVTKFTVIEDMSDSRLQPVLGTEFNCSLDTVILIDKSWYFTKYDESNQVVSYVSDEENGYLFLCKNITTFLSDIEDMKNELTTKLEAYNSALSTCQNSTVRHDCFYSLGMGWGYTGWTGEWVNHAEGSSGSRERTYLEDAILRAGQAGVSFSDVEASLDAMRDAYDNVYSWDDYFQECGKFYAAYGPHCQTTDPNDQTMTPKEIEYWLPVDASVGYDGTPESMRRASIPGSGAYSWLSYEMMRWHATYAGRNRMKGDFYYMTKPESKMYYDFGLGPHNYDALLGPQKLGGYNGFFYPEVTDFSMNMSYLNNFKGYVFDPTCNNAPQGVYWGSDGNYFNRLTGEMTNFTTG